jgi:hypothetical protein
VGHAVLGPGFKDRLVEVAPVVVGGSLDVLVTLALGAMLVLIGALHLIDGWQLNRIRLVIDASGISREGWEPFVVSWQDVRRVAVTAGDRGSCRLLVDTVRSRHPGGRPAPSALAAPSSGC